MRRARRHRAAAARRLPSPGGVKLQLRCQAAKTHHSAPSSRPGTLRHSEPNVQLNESAHDCTKSLFGPHRSGRHGMGRLASCDGRRRRRATTATRTRLQWRRRTRHPTLQHIAGRCEGAPRGTRACSGGAVSEMACCASSAELACDGSGSSGAGAGDDTRPSQQLAIIPLDHRRRQNHRRGCEHEVRGGRRERWRAQTQRGDRRGAARWQAAHASSAALGERRCGLNTRNACFERNVHADGVRGVTKAARRLALRGTLRTFGTTVFHAARYARAGHPHCLKALINLKARWLKLLSPADLLQTRSAQSIHRM